MIASCPALFASPVFYPANALPETLSAFLFVNPLTYPIEEVRNLLFAGQTSGIRTYVVYALTSLAVASIGFAFFQRTRDAFADVV